MPGLDLMLLGNDVMSWARALLAWGGGILLLLLLRRFLGARLESLARRTATLWDDLLVALVSATKTVTLAVFAAWPALGWLSLNDRTLGVAKGISVVVGGFQLAIWGNLLIARLLEDRVTRLREADPATATTLGGLTILARGVLWALLLLVVLDNLGVNISTLVAGLGIGGVAIALATQNILGDLFGSLSIVLDKPFVVGDFIVIGDMMGTVDRIGLKTTRVKSLSGEQLVFANSDLLSSRVRNYKRMRERRVVFSVGVTYQTPAATLTRLPGVLREIVSGQPGVRFDRAHLRSFDDSAVTFEVVYYVLDPDYNRYMDIQQDINLAIFRRFEREEIEFAYPTRTLHLRPSEIELPPRPRLA